MKILIKDSHGNYEVHEVDSLGYEPDVLDNKTRNVRKFGALYFNSADGRSYYNEHISLLDSEKICKELYDKGRTDISDYGYTLTDYEYEEKYVVCHRDTHE